jgi:hypothetical protein
MALSFALKGNLKAKTRIIENSNISPIYKKYIILKKSSKIKKPKSFQYIL